MANKMLIDASHPEETRVVVLRGNRVDEFDFESASKKPLRGNIYLAKVTRVEPSLQAAFVEYGGNRHGFLAFSEIHPDYYQIPVADRQALLEEEQRQHKEEEEDEPRQKRNNRRRRGRNGRERRARNGDTVSADAPGSTEASADVRIASTASPIEESQIEGSRVEDVQAGAQTPESESPETAATSSESLLNSADEAPARSDEIPPPAGPIEPENAVASADEPGAGRQAPQEQQAAQEEEAAGTLEPGDRVNGGRQDEDSEDEDGEDEDESGDAEDEDDEDEDDDEEADEDEEDDEDEDDEDEDEEDDAGEEADDEHVEQVGGDDVEELPVRAPRSRRQYKIQEVIRRRQVLLVQVVKEERGNKGAALTTYLSLAGRYSVLMPNTARGGGISRKITDSDDRRRMKEIAQDLDVPEGMGVILRTAGASRSKQEVRRDFEHLLRMWESVRELTLQSTAPTLVYEEGSLIKRTVRDLYSEEIDEIVVAGDEGYKEARDYMRMLMPSHARKIQHWRETQPLFARMGVEAQLDAMFSAQVTLKSGGYIVINQTEALVAIDVNSGRSTREHNIEDTALRTNLEAADEVARQLRLRDLAGLIVVDFIDMEENRNNRAVERRLKEALKNDRARIQVGRISHFGLLEMSRQRMRTGVLEGSSVVCPHCNGAGTVRSTSSIALHILRVIEDALVRNAQYNLDVRTRSVVALYMLNQKRAHLREIEERFGVTITIAADDTLQGSVYHVLERGELASAPPAPPRLGLVQIDSLALPEAEEEEETETETETETEIAEADEEEGDEERGSDAQGENGKRKRRRRRRRGRDREPSGIDSEAPQPSDDALAAMVRIDGDFPAAAAAVVGDGEVDENDAEKEGDAAIAEAHVEGERDGRRRRRSRRGPRRGERAEAGDHTAQPGFRSPFGSWVRSADEGEPAFNAGAEPVDLTAFAPGAEGRHDAPPEGSPSAEASVGDVMAAEPKPEIAPAPAAETSHAESGREAPPEASPAAEASMENVMAAEPKQEAAPAEPAAQAEPVPPAAPEPPAARVEPLPEAPPPAQKKGGWWQRAKSQITGG